jgi:hypothetical protein
MIYQYATIRCGSSERSALNDNAERIGEGNIIDVVRKTIHEKPDPSATPERGGGKSHFKSSLHMLITESENPEL